MRKDVLNKELTALRRKLKSVNKREDEIQSLIAQYACVSANGCIESYLRESVTDKFRSRCAPQALRIIYQQIRPFSNFNHKKIVNFFQRTWKEPAENIEIYLKQHEQFSDALGSIVINKNRVSHNGSSNVSPLQIDDWLETIIKHLDDFNSICFS